MTVEEQAQNTTQIAEEVAHKDAAPSLRLRWFYAGALAVLLLDQITKTIVRSFLEVGDSYPLLPGIAHLGHVQNRGAAFGLFAESTGLLTLVKVAVCVFIICFARPWVSKSRWLAVAFALIFGGALGNLIDALRFGFVTDFIDLNTSIPFVRDWPVFNVADMALSVGTVMLIGDLLLHTKPKDSKSTGQ